MASPANTGTPSLSGSLGLGSGTPQIGAQNASAGTPSLSGDFGMGTGGPAADGLNAAPASQEGGPQNVGESAQQLTDQMGLMVMTLLLGALALMMQMVQGGQNGESGGPGGESGGSPSLGEDFGAPDSGGATGPDADPAPGEDAPADSGGGGSLSAAVPANVRQWEGEINAAAQRHNVPPAMLAAVMSAESNGDANAGSSAGAQGLMQFMPATFQDVAGRNGIQGDILDPAANVEASAAYLSELHERYGNWEDALGYYNGGGRGVTNPAAETRAYIPKVMDNFRNFSA